MVKNGAAADEKKTAAPQERGSTMEKARQKPAGAS
jgi:hypothetical protein